ncbi:sodium:solute symporter [Rapidithrix thailandica]|uniref:Sodium:solute symporter n=1 Tax=Rapidithrix thailandica TaxID=413964 RepID=A0AAW9S9I0_9BACT
MDITAYLHTLDVIVILGYLITLIFIGLYASRKVQKSGDLFLGGRHLRWGNIGFSIWGTNVGPSMLVASASLAYSTGVVGGNFSWLAFPLLILLSMVFVPKYLHTQISTTPEFLSKRFSESTRDLLSWYNLVAIMILWLGGTLYAGGIMISQLLNWPLILSVTALMGVAISFTVAGGLVAVVYTDTFQMVLLIIASVILTVFGIYEVGGVEKLICSVPEDYWHLFRPASDPEYPWHALVLGYPVLGIWFWCTDQTIVQRVLGARDLRHGQQGVLFTGWLKILDTFIFMIPGIACFVLFPQLEDPDTAYLTMVTRLLPSGLVGLVIAVIIAALISTVDSGLNSLSTVFTLDIYAKKIKPQATDREKTRMGRWVTVIGGIVSVVLALSLSLVEKNLFALFQSIISYLAPPMATVFLLGVLWKRANTLAANTTLIFGSILCLGIGIADLSGFPEKGFFPPFLLMSFYLFAGLCSFMVVLSLLTRPPQRHSLPGLKAIYRAQQYSTTTIWWLWGILVGVMLGLYILFN